MIHVLDVAGAYECRYCGCLARPREEAGRCTSCRDWQDHGVIPATLASARQAAEEAGENAVYDRHEDSDRVCREIADRLVTLERRRVRRNPVPQPRRFRPFLPQGGDGGSDRRSRRWDTN